VNIPPDYGKPHFPVVLRELSDVASTHVLYKIRVSFEKGFCGSIIEGAARLQGELDGFIPRTDGPVVTAEQIAVVECEEDRVSEGDPEEVRGILTLGVAVASFPEPLEIPLLIAAGTYLSTYAYITYFELLNISFPPDSQIGRFRGPKFGPEFLDQQSRLPLGAILKPRFIEDRQYLRSWVDSAVAAKLDYISDDELTVGTTSLNFGNRVLEVTKRLRDCGSQITYIPNVTGSVDQVIKRCEVASDEGVKAVLLNVHAMGYDAVATVSESYPQLALVACALGVGTVCRESRFGISLSVIARLARMAGADAFYTGVFGGVVSSGRDTPATLHRALCGTVTSDGLRLKQSSAVIAGGVGLPELVRTKHIYSGSFIAPFGHPFSQARSEGVDLVKYVSAVRSGFNSYATGGEKSFRAWAESSSVRRYPKAIRDRLRIQEAISEISEA